MHYIHNGAFPLFSLFSYKIVNSYMIYMIVYKDLIENKENKELL